MTSESGVGRLPTLADVAGTYARTALDAVRREYPNAPRHTMTGPDDRPTPRGAHPAFYGCFDWHSAVEMHWALVRMLRLVPEAVPAGEVRGVLDEHLSASALRAEAEYLHDNPTFERPYGWGWLLQLAAELDDWASEDATVVEWATAVRPAAEVVGGAFTSWLPRLTYPERVGMHQNSAFALCRALPWAVSRAGDGRPELMTALSDAAVRWFAHDVEYPTSWEPGGSDFLSPALTEAQLIAAVASPASAFPEWLSLFWPELADGRPHSLLTPAVVADPTDGQGAHLHGLNLYRAHAFTELAVHLDVDDPRRAVLLDARLAHAAVSLPAVSGGGWMLEHWLAAFAVLLLG